jgi:hypothetical protein
MEVDAARPLLPAASPKGALAGGARYPAGPSTKATTAPGDQCPGQELQQPRHHATLPVRLCLIFRHILFAGVAPDHE